VEQDLAWLKMVRRGIPSLLDNDIETGKPQPQVLEPETPRPTRPTIIGEEERTVVREERGESMEDVGVKGHVPLGVAIESVELAHSRITNVVGLAADGHLT
jgi:hypothetical protein